MPTLTPTRQRGFEYLDAPGIDPATRCRSLRDVARANALFGGTHAVLAELEPVLRGLGPHVTLLDVGSGLGDIPQRARASAARLGVRMQTFGLDSATELGPIIRTRGSVALCGDARFLPFRDRSVDVVICSQTLHHFVGDEVLTLVRELDRVARACVIVSDLRRSLVAAVGLWVASFPLGFHAVSRHDGVVSVMRGFLPEELGAAVRSAVGRTPVVRRHWGFRVTARWNPERE